MKAYYIVPEYVTRATDARHTLTHILRYAIVMVDNGRTLKYIEHNIKTPSRARARKAYWEEK